MKTKAATLRAAAFQLDESVARQRGSTLYRVLLHVRWSRARRPPATDR
jgi:hypothetical protein